MSEPIIYLDYNATTPVDPEVEAAMRPYLGQLFGNPSSSYKYGSEARLAVEKARQQVAALINASPEEIIFNSGGSESDNHALKGAAFAYRHKGNHIIVSAIEHPAVLEVCKWLEKQGFEISLAPVDNDGYVLIEEFRNLLRPTTILASVMHSNNEVGALQPIAELAAIARRNGTLFHTDAAQSAGKAPLDVQALGVDMLTLAGHKFYAPKGVGALYVRKGVELDSLIHGASQEQSRRAGTENLLEIVGLGKAAEIALRDLAKNSAHLLKMRNLLASGLLQQIPALKVFGNPENTLPNTFSVGFPHVLSQTLLSALPGIAASAGAACHPSGAVGSHVMQAMGVEPHWASGMVRFSVGKYTSLEEVEKAVLLIGEAYRPLSTQSQPSELKTNEEIKLTQFTHGLGCACKMRPADLEAILKNMPAITDKRVLVGNASGDDAAVYQFNENQAIVQTLDFFTPIVDDPYDFGAIAAANALSDVYAMGGRPLFALNIVGFPTGRLPLQVLEKILQGASEKASEAGIFVIGGHSIEDTEPKFGMCVTGEVHPQKIWKNIGAQLGDVLILTKPLGTGIISTAAKRGIADVQTMQRAIGWMKQLNRKAADVLSGFEVHACTDITGFGLLGHLSEMTRGSGVNAEISFANLPFINGVKQLAMQGAIPGGTEYNLSFYSAWLQWASPFSEVEKLMAADAQTSGGLLAAVPPNMANQAVEALHKAGVEAAVVIGKITSRGNGMITVV